MVIQEYLVDLGFNVDKLEYRKFTDVFKIIGTGVRSLNIDLEKLYYTSERTNTSVSSLQNLGFAFSKLGLQAGDAVAAIESFSEFVRSTPSSGRFLEKYGASLYDSRGQLREMSDVLQDYIKGISRVPYYLQLVLAKTVGIGEQQLIALKKGTKAFEEQRARLYAKANVNIQDAAKASVKFNNTVRDIGVGIGALWDKILVSTLSTNQNIVQKIHDFLYAHFDDVNNFINYVLGKLSDITDWAIQFVKKIPQYGFVETVKLEIQKLKPVVDNITNFAVRKWSDIAPKLLDVISVLFDFFKLQGAKAVDYIADYFSDSIKREWEDIKRWFVTPLGEFKPTTRPDVTAGFGDIGTRLETAIGALLNAVVPSASASEAPTGPTTPASMVREAPTGPASTMREKIGMANEFFAGKGFTKAQIAGILGSMMQESKLSEGAVNPESGAFGIAQWLGSRKNKLLQDKAFSFGEQLEFIWKELQTSENAALQKIIHARTVRDASDIWTSAFERPGKDEMLLGKRYKFAMDIYNQLQSQAPQSSSITINNKTDINVNGSSGSPDDLARGLARQQEKLPDIWARMLDNRAR